MYAKPKDTRPPRPKLALQRPASWTWLWLWLETRSLTGPSLPSLRFGLDPGRRSGFTAPHDSRGRSMGRGEGHEVHRAKGRPPLNRARCTPVERECGARAVDMHACAVSWRGVIRLPMHSMIDCTWGWNDGSHERLLTRSPHALLTVGRHILSRRADVRRSRRHAFTPRSPWQHIFSRRRRASVTTACVDLI